MSFSFSATSAMNLAGSPVTGQHSRTILADLGYTAAEIDDLVADGVVRDHQPARVLVTEIHHDDMVEVAG